MDEIREEKYYLHGRTRERLILIAEETGFHVLDIVGVGTEITRRIFTRDGDLFVYWPNGTRRFGWRGYRDLADASDEVLYYHRRSEDWTRTEDSDAFLVGGEKMQELEDLERLMRSGSPETALIGSVSAMLWLYDSHDNGYYYGISESGLTPLPLDIFKALRESFKISKNPQ